MPREIIAVKETRDILFCVIVFSMIFFLLNIYFVGKSYAYSEQRPMPAIDDEDEYT